MPPSRTAAKGGGQFAAHRVGRGEHADHLALARDHQQRLALRFELQRGRHIVHVGEHARAAHRDQLPINPRAHAQAGHRCKVFWRAHRNTALRSGGAHGCGKRMLGVALGARRERKHPVFRQPVQGNDIGDLRAALRSASRSYPPAGHRRAPRISRYLPPLISRPRLAAAPMLASIAIGVASANEQEQATTSTAVVGERGRGAAGRSARRWSPPRAGRRPRSGRRRAAHRRGGPRPPPPA